MLALSACTRVAQRPQLLARMVAAAPLPTDFHQISTSSCTSTPLFTHCTSLLNTLHGSNAFHSRAASDFGNGVTRMPFGLSAAMSTTASDPQGKADSPRTVTLVEETEAEDEDDQFDEVFAHNETAEYPMDPLELERALEAFSAQVYPATQAATVPDLALKGLEAGNNHITLGMIPEVAFAVPEKAAFAVVLIGGHQHKVTTNDFLYVDKIKRVAVGEMLVFNQVLLLGSVSETIIGRPFVPSGAVVAVVEQQTRDSKEIVFKKKRRKNYRRKTGFRTPLTQLRILDIVGVDE